MRNYLINKKSKKIKINISSALNKNNKEVLKVTVFGPLGELSYIFNNINYTKSNKFFVSELEIHFFIKKIKKLITSVTNGWFVELNLNGLGFKSFKLNDQIALDLGYSNLILYKPSLQLTVKNFKNKLVLFSLNDEYLNNICNVIQNYSKPDPYKGKGILYRNQIIKLKKKSKS